jgi:hypothetical protein
MFSYLFHPNSAAHKDNVVNVIFVTISRWTYLFSLRSFLESSCTGVLTIKYDKAESNVRELKRLGSTVLHGVDAETMKLHSYLEMRRFDRIVFNFPHAGFKGREHHLHVIQYVY